MFVYVCGRGRLLIQPCAIEWVNMLADLTLSAYECHQFCRAQHGWWANTSKRLVQVIVHTCTCIYLYKFVKLCVWDSWPLGKQAARKT